MVGRRRGMGDRLRGMEVRRRDMGVRPSNTVAHRRDTALRRRRMAAHRCSMAVHLRGMAVHLRGMAVHLRGMAVRHPAHRLHMVVRPNSTAAPRKDTVVLHPDMAVAETRITAVATTSITINFMCPMHPLRRRCNDTGAADCRPCDSTRG
jgi:hypothetical protein